MNTKYIIIILLMLGFLFGCTDTSDNTARLSPQELIDMNNRINAGPIDIQVVQQPDINIQLIVADSNKIDTVYISDVNYVLYTPPDIIPVNVKDSLSIQYRTEPKINTFNYFLNGQKYNISFEVYKGLDDYLVGLHSKYCPVEDLICDNNSIQLSYINEPQQHDEIIRFVNSLKIITENHDDQARIAISLIQSIEYDYSYFICSAPIQPLCFRAIGDNTPCPEPAKKQCFPYKDPPGRYTYEILYNNVGICGEKSRLLASILKELGYATVLFFYEKENHEAVGIKCQQEYSYLGTGYCFIESTNLSIITDYSGDYGENSEPTPLGPYSEIIYVSNGKSFDATNEYNMVLYYNNIINKIDELKIKIDNLKIKTNELDNLINEMAPSGNVYNDIIDEYNKYNDERNILIDEYSTLIDKYNPYTDGNFWAFYNQ